jgi:TrmH family RNA methyltransferase
MISKNQIKLIQSLHQKKFRDHYSLFLAEGIKTVKELISLNDSPVKEVYATNDFVIENRKELQSKKFQLFEVSEKELEQISTLSTPNKVLAVCNYIEGADNKFDFSNHFSLYLDDIRDPGNFGTIIRLADWYGITTIYCSPTSCDLYNPKVIQSTMGAFMRVRVKYVNLNNVIENEKNLKVYGAVLGGKNIYKEKVERGLIVIGNEANGISKENMKLLTDSITIPSHNSNGSESLNAAMAAGIIVSEFFRQLY